MFLSKWINTREISTDKLEFLASYFVTCLKNMLKLINKKFFVFALLNGQVLVVVHAVVAKTPDTFLKICIETWHITKDTDSEICNVFNGSIYIIVIC